ncbi:MAG: DNA translocase FtsK [Phycisphaerae bacterium]|jgi:S-DNA-T family DNA segregation ATPase FtsK/SpoIIIE
MAQSVERRVALRFCLTTIRGLAALFLWVCVLSFSTGDPPASSVWQLNPDGGVSNLCGSTGAWIAYYLFYYLGIGTYALLGLLTLMAVAWPRQVPVRDPALRALGVVLVTAAVCTWGALLVSPSDKYLMTGPGGVLGAAVGPFCRAQLRIAGTHIVLSCALIVGLLLAADELLVRLVRWLGWTSRRSIPVLARGGEAVAKTGAAVASGVATGVTVLSRGLTGNGRQEPAEEEIAAPRRKKKTVAKPEELEEEEEEEPEEEEEVDEEVEAEEDEAEEEEPVEVEPPRQLTFDAAKKRLADEAPARDVDESGFAAAPVVAHAEVQAPAGKGAGAAGGRRTRRPAPLPEDDDYELPALELLEPPVPMDKSAIEVLCREKAYILEQTLNEFRVGVQVVAIETGPVITVFELKLSPGVKVSQIASLSNDIARALKAPAVRVVAPLPGKNTIGIEVPNTDKEKVRLRDIMELSGRRTDNLALPLYLGKDASGQPLISDLTRMPHLLIAGTTGSGKSICVNSIILSMLLTRSPSEVNMILVDPKMVELAGFKDIPHLMCPIVTEAAKAEGILEWATGLMDERYALLAEAGVREIRAYNRLGRDGLKERMSIASDEELARIPLHLPYIVIIIDELADLMMTSAKEVEFNLCRIAQKSRAVGIHLIVSTQRPQANVVTGLIKSNLPCRIAFRVSSRLDSRIVLDQNGGETLMGQGDMLFLAPGTSKLLRAQGTFISDEEMRSVVKHCREQRTPDFHPDLVRMPGAGAATTGERDELFDQAVDAVIETGRGSVSLLQRRLTIGYGRASRLIDQMYEAGIVGEYKGSQAREVIVTKEEWQAARSQRDREEADEAAEFPME